MTGSIDPPLGRAQALGSLRAALDGLSELAGRLDAAESDRERREALLWMVTGGLLVRDRAAEAYGALEYERDVEGLGRGVLE